MLDPMLKTQSRCAPFPKAWSLRWESVLPVWQKLRVKGRFRRTLPRNVHVNKRHHLLLRLLPLLLPETGLDDPAILGRKQIWTFDDIQEPAFADQSLEIAN